MRLLVRAESALGRIERTLIAPI